LVVTFERELCAEKDEVVYETIKNEMLNNKQYSNSEFEKEAKELRIEKTSRSLSNAEINCLVFLNVSVGFPTVFDGICDSVMNQLYEDVSLIIFH
jgi:hypothetical protein